jgi:hypothetical protein
VGILIEPRQTVAVHGAIADVEATHNGSRGIFVSGEKSAAASANILMRDINASGSFSDGIASVGAGTTVTTTRTIGTGNFNGLGRYNGFTGSGQGFSYGDNRFKGNLGNEVNGSPTQLPGQ